MKAHPHSLDEVIGTKPRSGADVAADLAKSPAFTAAIDRAVAESNQGQGGSFAVRVRHALARELAEGRVEE